MSLELIKRTWNGEIREVTIGATAEEGGTRDRALTIGGSKTLPFLHFEGEVKNSPIIGIEICDIKPSGWPEDLVSCYGDALEDPVAWAKKAEEAGADLLYLILQGADPDGQDRSGAELAALVKSILEQVKLPLAIVGCGNEEKDNQIMREVAEAAQGERCLLGIAEEENYNSIVGACMLGGHNVIARSPIDVNICKQLNILITDMGLEASRIVIDPVVSSLGYGMEYSYSVMERIRSGALRRDKMLGMPMICIVGPEVWRKKESYAPEEEFPQWGSSKVRGVLWETLSATTYLQGGAEIVIVRHPESVKLVRENIQDLMKA